MSALSFRRTSFFLGLLGTGLASLSVACSTEAEPGNEVTSASTSSGMSVVAPNPSQPTPVGPGTVQPAPSESASPNGSNPDPVGPPSPASSPSGTGGTGPSGTGGNAGVPGGGSGGDPSGGSGGEVADGGEAGTPGSGGGGAPAGGAGGEGVGGSAGGTEGGAAGMATAGSGGMPGTGEFSFTSPAWENNEECAPDNQAACPLYPEENTRFGADVSPELNWTAGPPGTMSYAVVLHDLSNEIGGGPFGHWALWNIPADVTTLPEGLEGGSMPAFPEGSTQVSFEMDNGYTGSGACGNVYEFLLFALDVETFTPTGMVSASSVRDQLVASPNMLEMASMRVQSRDFCE